MSIKLIKETILNSKNIVNYRATVYKQVHKLLANWGYNE